MFHRDGDVPAVLRAASHGVVVGRFETRRFRMKIDLQLKVQSWVDGELPDDEARRIGEWIAGDAEASALAAELGCIKQAMSGNEVAAPLGESREFYWSKIERQIQREATLNRARPTPWYAGWRRYLAPALSVAALACVVVVAVRQ